MREHEILNLYPASYRQAREQFLASARQADAAIFSQTLPGLTGPADEPLIMDAAYLGSFEARKVLVMLAGTHGSEAYAASPLMSAFLQQLHNGARPMQDCAILLVHAVNPYGFAHTLRTNENNVDLNRNFIDFDKPLPSNPDYPAVHPLLCPEDTSDEGLNQAARGLNDWIQSRGQAHFLATVFNGQYEIPGGLIYGGQQREWSNHALEKVARRFLTQAQEIAFIDWHTGLGRYGEPFFLCFNAPDSSQWEKCCQWWGRDAIETTEGFNGAARPDYRGLVFYGMQEFCAHADFAGAVIEIGTTPPEETIAGLQLDNRLRHEAVHVAGRRAAMLERAMESFCPADPQWRLSAIRHGLRIIGQVLNSLQH